MMCGSSWFFLCERYVRLVGCRARLFFVLFFLFTVLLTNIVLCVLIEFIIFQIRYRSQLRADGQGTRPQEADGIQSIADLNHSP